MKQKIFAGFTFLGILAAVAIPKFIANGADASMVATKTIAGALSSANASNFASRSLNATLGNPVANCTDIANILQGGLPSGYSIRAANITSGTTLTCTVTGPDSTSATFSATGIS